MVAMTRAEIATIELIKSASCQARPTPLIWSLLVMYWVIPEPHAIRIEYRNGKRFRRIRIKTGDILIPASPCRVEQHLPTSIPANDSASDDISYESSIPFDSEKGVFIYFSVKVLDWKEMLVVHT
jgi:hypothetical protein